MKSKLLASLILLAAIAYATPPSWVQPGVVATYDGVSSGIQNGQPVNGVQVLVVMTVTSVSGNTVSGSTRVTTPQNPFWENTTVWSCTDGQPCMWRFWVDPANPAGSVKGPNGEPLTDGGTVPYQPVLGGPAVSGTNMLYYANADTHVEYHLVYQTRTGLMASYAEKYPSLQTYLYFKSVSVNLDNYQPPAGGIPGTGGNGGNGSACPVGVALGVAACIIGVAVWRGGNRQEN